MREGGRVSKMRRTDVQNEANWCPEWGEETDATDKTDWGKSKTPISPIGPIKSSICLGSGECR